MDSNQISLVFFEFFQLPDTKDPREIHLKSENNGEINVFLCTDNSPENSPTFSDPLFNNINRLTPVIETNLKQKLGEFKIFYYLKILQYLFIFILIPGFKGSSNSNSFVRNLSKSIEDASMMPDKYYANCKQEFEEVGKEELSANYEDYIQLPTVTKPVVIKQEPLQAHVMQPDNLLNLPIIMNSSSNNCNSTQSTTTTSNTTPTAASLSSKLDVAIPPETSNPNTLNSCNIDQHQPPSASQNSVRNAFLSSNEYNLSPAITDCKFTTNILYIHFKFLSSIICVACGFFFFKFKLHF